MVYQLIAFFQLAGGQVRDFENSFRDGRRLLGDFGLGDIVLERLSYVLDLLLVVELKPAFDVLIRGFAQKVWGGARRGARWLWRT